MGSFKIYEGAILIQINGVLLSESKGLKKWLTLSYMMSTPQDFKSVFGHFTTLCMKGLKHVTWETGAVLYGKNVE